MENEEKLNFEIMQHIPEHLKEQVKNEQATTDVSDCLEPKEKITVLEDVKPKPKGLIIYRTQLEELLNDYTLEENGLIFRAIIYYFMNAEENPELIKEINKDRALKIFYRNLKKTVDIDNQKYINTCLKNQNSINEYWKKKKSKSGYSSINGIKYAND